jgi:arylsulfatase A-like enzyme
MKDVYNIVLGLVALLAAPFAMGQQGDKPNIILIMADDLGYGDVNFDPAKKETPHLRQLAAEGMRLLDYHSNGPVCSPTRAALMTGRYQQRSKIENALGRDAKGLPLSEITVANYLKQAGYATAVYGKWHLGTVPEANPVKRGFDEFRGHLNSVDYHSHIGPWGNKDWWVDDKLQNEEGYNSDLIANHTIRFINEHKSEPFFIYVPFSNIHFPWCTPDDPEFFAEGTDYMKSVDTKLGPHSPHEDVTLVVRRMIAELDKAVGRIVDEVKKQGLAENTLIVFVSDNGGYIDYRGRHKNQISNNGPLRGQKSDLYEGGTRVPAIAWWPGKIKPGSESKEVVMAMDLLPTFLDVTGNVSSVKPGHELDGRSAKSVLLNNTAYDTRMVYWRYKNQGAVRDGDWKLVFTRESNSGEELFNLKNDLGEKKNLAGRYPQEVKRLRNSFVEWEKNFE